MNQYELESFELNFYMYDHNDIFQNELIGSYSMGLSTIYRHANHEFYKVWLRLVDTSTNPTASVAYLRVSCFIVGPDQKHPHHGDDENNEDEVQEDEKNLDIQAYTEMQIKRQGMSAVFKPDLFIRPFQFIINLYKAEGLPFND